MPDEFRQQAMGFRGEDPVITPCLDKFAKEALCVENAISSYPVCSPYRGMLLSGQYPWSNGVITNCNTATKGFGVYLKEKQICLTDVLSQNGYDCGYIGKWHLDAPEVSEAAYLEGFRSDGKIWDAYTRPGTRRHGMNFWYAYGCNDKHFKPHYWMNDDKVEDVRHINQWSVEHETDVAVDYITNNKGYRDEDKPFILFVAYNPPHMPFEEVPQIYKDRYKKEEEQLLTRPNINNRPKEAMIEHENKSEEEQEKIGLQAKKHVKNYFAAVTGVDENFGRILKALEESGLEEDTIVIFTSDHGEMMGSQGLMHKSVWYDESFKVPFLIRYKGHIAPGKKDFFVGPTDLMPTLLELVGLSDKLPKGVEGVSTAKAILGEEEGPSEGYYINTQLNTRGIKTKDYTFVTVRNAHGDESYILYDTQEDKYQLHNIADEKPAVVRVLRERLEEWLEKTNDLWLK